MADQPAAEEVSLWQRRLASQANNRAWTLSEQLSRSPDGDEEMLQAAHAAMYFWNIVGNSHNKAHAAQLVAHVYAALKQAGPAAHYLAKSQPTLMADTAQAWERALAHAVSANVAAAAHDAAAHAHHYREAAQQIAALPDPEDRSILEKTLKVLPVPTQSAG